MKTLLRIALCTIGLLTINNLTAQEKFSLTVKVQNISSNKGKMFFAVYNNEAKFLQGPLKMNKVKISDNQSSVVFSDLPFGIYAVSIYHDENSNGKLDSNFLGIPKEDYGFSNDAKGFMGPPKWDDAKFNLKEDMLISIEL